MAPSTTSSTLGWEAAVIDTESPSQLRPAVSQRMWISLTAGGRCVLRPCGASVGAMTCPFYGTTGRTSEPAYSTQSGRQAASADPRQLLAGQQRDHALTAHQG